MEGEERGEEVATALPNQQARCRNNRLLSVRNCSRELAFAPIFSPSPPSLSCSPSLPLPAEQSAIVTGSVGQERRSIVMMNAHFLFKR